MSSAPATSTEAGSAPGRARDTLRRNTFLFQDGLMLSATLRGLEVAGLLKPALASDSTLAELRPDLSESAFGYCGWRCDASPAKGGSRADRVSRSRRPRFASPRPATRRSSTGSTTWPPVSSWPHSLIPARRPGRIPGPTTVRSPCMSWWPGRALAGHSTSASPTASVSSSWPTSTAPSPYRRCSRSCVPAPCAARHRGCRTRPRGGTWALCSSSWVGPSLRAPGPRPG